jgi:hypothetical protein
MASNQQDFKIIMPVRLVMAIKTPYIKTLELYRSVSESLAVYIL